jgi:hypothetical protein
MVTMVWRFNALTGLVLTVLSLQSPPALHRYTGPKQCGFEFDYPSQWVASAAGDNKPCRVQLRPRDFAARMKEDGVDLYTVELGPESGDFLVIAAANGFDFVKAKWVTRGRQGMNTPAEVVATERWNGLRGIAATGCYRESGGYAGLCERPLILLRDEGGSTWSMTGGPQSESAFDAVLATFRFLER